MNITEHAAILQLGFTAVLVVGSAMGTAYKIIRKLDEMSQNLTNHCTTCIERHLRLDNDVQKIDGRLEIVERDLSGLIVTVAEHHAIAKSKGKL